MWWFSSPVVPHSLWPHGLQQASLPCPSPSPGACPLSQWCHPTIASSVVPFSSCLQSASISALIIAFHCQRTTAKQKLTLTPCFWGPGTEQHVFHRYICKLGSWERNIIEWCIKCFLVSQRFFTVSLLLVPIIRVLPNPNENWLQGLPDSPAVRTLHSPCWWPRFNSRSGNWNPTSHASLSKKKVLNGK